MAEDVVAEEVWEKKASASTDSVVTGVTGVVVVLLRDRAGVGGDKDDDEAVLGIEDVEVEEVVVLVAEDVVEFEEVEAELVLVLVSVVVETGVVDRVIVVVVFLVAVTVVIRLSVVELVCVRVEIVSVSKALVAFGRGLGTCSGISTSSLPSCLHTSLPVSRLRRCETVERPSPDVDRKKAETATRTSSESAARPGMRPNGLRLEEASIFALRPIGIDFWRRSNQVSYATTVGRKTQSKGQ